MENQLLDVPSEEVPTMFATAFKGCFLGLVILASPAPAAPETLPVSPMVGSGELPSPEEVDDPDQLTRMLEAAADEAYRLALSEKHPADIFFWDPGTSDEQRVLDRIVSFRTRAETVEQDVVSDRSAPPGREEDRGPTHESWRTFAEDIGDGRNPRRITGHEVEQLRDAADDVIEALDYTSMPRTKRYWILNVQPILARLESLSMQ